jgi:RNA recognition motif-containing protein
LQIYVGNLDPNVTEDELKLICAQIGEINYVKIPANKGCGFVQFTARYALPFVSFFYYETKYFMGVLINVSCFLF